MFSSDTAPPSRETWQLLAIIVTSPITIPIGLMWNALRGAMTAMQRNQKRDQHA